MRPLELSAPAKVNLYLEVVGRRPDGYHDLRMLVAPVSWFDRLVLEPLDEPGRVEFRVDEGDAVPPGEDNLCVRAARYYFRRTGVAAGVRIALSKRIPAGAGLGGGSSDAATTVIGLERLFGRRLDDEARRRCAFEVGADVPFFFARGPAWVEGIGERVHPLEEAPELWLVIVWPAEFLSTARVFSRLTKGLTSRGRPPRIAQFDFRGVGAVLRNDLQPASVLEAPVVGRALELLKSTGTSHVLVSGSGSAVFGLCRDRRQAERVAEALRSEPGTRGWTVRAVHTLRPGAFPFRWPRRTSTETRWGVAKR